MAAYLEACLEEANGEVALISKALTHIARAKKKQRRLLSNRIWGSITDLLASPDATDPYTV